MAQAAQAPAHRSLAQSSPLPAYTTNSAVAELLEAMFYRFRGANEKLDPKLKSAFKERFGYEMMDNLEGDRIAAFYFEGPPGHGKTSGFEAAAKEFTKLLGLNFVTPIEGQEVGQNDFVYNVISVGGAVHKMDFDGMIAKNKDRDGKDYMTHVPGWKMLKARDSAYSMILYDDFPTSAPQVQASLLDMTLEGHSSSINFNKGGGRARAGSSHVFVGFCGNVGARDGNSNNNQISAATANRIWRAHIEDTPTDWAARVIKTFNDAIGDAHMSAFVRSHEDLFSMPPSGPVKGQFTSPRSLVMATSYIRRRWHEAVARGGTFGDNKESQAVIGRMQRGLEGFIGKEVAAKVAAFYTALITSAEPLAEAAIYKGDIKVDEIRKRMNDGNDVSGLNFAYSFASALAQKASIRIGEVYPDETLATDKPAKKRTAKEKLDDFSGIMSNFAKATCQLDHSTISFAIDTLFKRLAATRPALFHVHSGALFVPKEEYMERMGKAFYDPASNPFLNDDLHQTIMNALSTFNNYMTSNTGGVESILKKSAARSA